MSRWPLPQAAESRVYCACCWAQILACGVVAWLADPHFTPRDPRSGEDWRMIAARLAEPPYTDATRHQGGAGLAGGGAVPTL